MKKKYKVGDKVRVKVFDKRPPYWNSEGEMDHLMGKVATIEEVIDDDRYSIYDKSCGHSWCIHATDFEPACECIVIYRKDDEVIALDKSTGEKATAKCNPSDEFDFKIGAKIAFERLLANIGSTEYYNGTIVFNKNDGSCITAGRLYDVKNGKIRLDNGCIFPNIATFMTLADIKAYFGDRSTGGYKGHWFNSSNPLEVMEIEQ